MIHEETKKPLNSDNKVLWNEKEAPVKDMEHLLFDNSAYVMLHRSSVEWPCLSLDFLIKERCQQYQST